MKLNERLAHAGIKPDTYKQNWRAAKRLIDYLSGETEAAEERNSRTDGWTGLLATLQILETAGVTSKSDRTAMTRLADASRKLGLGPRDLDCENAGPVLDCGGTPAERGAILAGLRKMENLPDLPPLENYRPNVSLASVTALRKKAYALPPHLEAERSDWVDRAARLAGRKSRRRIGEAYSAGSRQVMSSALGCYAVTAGELGHDLAGANTLLSLFSEETMESVVSAWVNAPAEAKREDKTDFSYVDSLCRILRRNDAVPEAEFLEGLKEMRGLRAGRDAGRRMSPGTVRWCMDLLADPARIERFERQHVEYYIIAREAQQEAAALGFDLLDLCDPNRMAGLAPGERGRAKGLLRRVRMFGTAAAYAAIALEGAPYRRTNILRLRHRGGNRTLFCHLEEHPPYLAIEIPNCELKNRDSLDIRGKTLPRIEIRAWDDGARDFGPEILAWYLETVRPLFLGAGGTETLFPPATNASPRPLDHLVPQTFDSWLALCSAEIGLPLTSHRFRHGRCSIALLYRECTMHELADFLGDTERTVSVYYGFVDRDRSAKRLQQSISRRRRYIEGDRP
ncbi:hypothetical protein [Mangrovicoccus ximenensis]|uniref:hypothetical protein n=1 Tax=Mangrovicoccus ximenensis TaxID=1911570 RepID=UPI0011AE7940|nr:hypothetical protein [Mangrovicoccus ximenensis]